MVLLDMAGSGNSTGCPTTGGTPDNRSAKVAIAWLNGHGTAREADGDPVPPPAWPDKDAHQATLWLRPGAPGGAGRLGLTPETGTPRTGTFQDSTNQSETTAITDETTVKPNRLAFLSEPLKRDMRISGTPPAELVASADEEDMNLGVILVDYGTDERVSTAGGGIRTLETEDCWGESSETDDPCYKQTAKNVATNPREVVTKGILDALNRNSLTQGEPLVPGTAYTFGFPLLPEDYVFKAGHRVGAVVVGSCRSHRSVPDETNATITLSLKESRLRLPVVGGRAAAEAAGF